MGDAFPTAEPVHAGPPVRRDPVVRADVPSIAATETRLDRELTWRGGERPRSGRRGTLRRRGMLRRRRARVNAATDGRRGRHYDNAAEVGTRSASRVTRVRAKRRRRTREYTSYIKYKIYMVYMVV